MATLDELYACYEELNNATNKSEKKDSYLTVLSGAKAGVNEKRLASQLISRFFKHFPDVHEEALNALLDLCEDADVAIRKQAIRDLPTICRECPSYTQRIADILTQLLQVEDAVELRLVEHSIMELARRDARETFAGILNQLESSTDDSIRSHAARFIGARVKELGDSGMLANVADCETYLSDRINEVMRKRKASLGGDEFVSLMTALSALKMMQTVTGRAHLVALACEQVVATVSEGSECDSEQLDKLLTCCKLTTPLLSKNVHANPIIEYVCTRVLPRLEATHADTPADAQADSKPAQKSDDLHLEVLKEFAEVCAFAGRFEPARADELVSHIVTALNGYLQAPAADDAASEATRTVTDAVDDLQLSHIECLLFAFHQLGRFVVAYSNVDGATKDDAERERDAKTVDALRELQKRLHLAARRVQQLRTKLNEALRSRPASRTETPDDKIKDAALRTLNNIFLLIRDLLHYPPLFKATITLSWKPPPPPAAPLPQTQPSVARQTSTSSSNGARQPPQTNTAPAKPNGAQKRPAEPPARGAPSTIPTVSKLARRARPTQAAIYQPPSARYSYSTGAGAGAGVSARPGTRPGISGPRATFYHPGSRGGIGRGGNRRGAFRGGRY